MPDIPRLAVAVIVEVTREPNAWEPWGWRIVDVVADDGRFGTTPRTLRTDERHRLQAFPGLEVALHRDEGEGYHLNLTSGAPVWFVMWRVSDDDPSIAVPQLVTLSYNEAARLLDAQERVDNVPLPPEIVAWLAAYTEAHYRPEPKERKRPASFRAPGQR